MEIECMIKLKDLIDKKDYKIFLDLDGVTCDFVEQFNKVSGDLHPLEYKSKYGRKALWNLVDAQGVSFWADMPWTIDGKILWDFIKDKNVEILSAPARSNTSVQGKRLWVDKHLGKHIKLNLEKAENKKIYAAPNHILIDDMAENIEGWISAGGIGILHKSSEDTIKRLKEIMGLE